MDCFRPNSLADVCLAMLNLIIGMGLPYRSQDADCGFIQAPAPRARKLCKLPNDSPRDTGPESHNFNGSPRQLLAHKAVYGDPVSNMRWYLKLTGFLNCYGFKPTDAAGCTQFLQRSSCLIIMAVMVDDHLVRCPREMACQDSLKYVNTHMNVDELRRTSLGIQRAWDRV